MAYVVRGNRGGRVLVYNHFRYVRNNSTQERIYWRCARAAVGCQAYIHTNVFNLQADAPRIRILSREPRHIHAEERDLIRTGRFDRRVMAMIAADPTKSVARIYTEAISDLRPGEQAREFRSMRSLMNRQRARHLPRTPADVDDINIQGIWGRTHRGRDFLSLQDPNWGLLVFSTRRNYQQLARYSILPFNTVAFV